jgi:uncharacterized protein (DUF1778 family)
MKDVQISGFVAESVVRDLEGFARARGLKKGFVIEQALRHHLQALKEIPEEFIVPVLTRESFERVVRDLRRSARPTSALRKLMKGKPIPEDGLHPSA